MEGWKSPKPHWNLSELALAETRHKSEYNILFTIMVKQSSFTLTAVFMGRNALTTRLFPCKLYRFQSLLWSGVSAQMMAALLAVKQRSRRVFLLSFSPHGQLWGAPVRPHICFMITAACLLERAVWNQWLPVQLASAYWVLFTQACRHISHKDSGATPSVSVNGVCKWWVNHIDGFN